jgi:hypothetical protein
MVLSHKKYAVRRFPENEISKIKMPKYVYLVKCETCREQIRLTTKTEAKRAFSMHLKKCSDVNPPELVEAPYVGS